MSMLPMPQIDDFNIKWQCIHCGAKQTVYMGDPNDLTLSDREAVRCFSCKKIELMVDEQDFVFIHNLFDDNDKPLILTPELIEKHAFVENGVAYA